MSDSAEHLRLVPAPDQSGSGDGTAESPTAHAGAPYPDQSGEALAAPSDPLVGTTIDGRYKILRQLGEGGMGVVYRAKHVMLGKDLAIKVLRAEVSKDTEIMARFRQEAQSASGIGSQHIIDISDFGQLPDGSTYFVMELLDGKELTSVIENEQPIPPDRVAHVGKQLCDALGKAHESGIVHRDMKPDNVFLVPRGKDPDFVKVLDFGIAKVGGANSKLTKAGQVFGTPHYMSPEQCAGQSVDHRTDIYAMGVILYEMACGRVPFDADNLMGILTKHIYEQPIPPHQLPPPINVPPGLEAVILKCLAKSVEHRYQSMAEVRADLEEFTAGRTPNAVMDSMNRSTGAIGAAGTGSHGALQVEVGGAGEGGGSKLPLVLGGVVGLLGLLAAGLVIYFLVLAREEPETIVIQPPPAPEVEEPVVEEPVVEPVTEEVEEVAEEMAAQRTIIQVASEPSGVEVLREDESGELVFVGNTPYELDQPESGQSVRIVLRQSGYRDHEVRVGRLSQSPLNVRLVEDRSAARRPSRRELREQRRQQQQQAQAPATEAPTATPVVRPATPPEEPRRVGGTEVLDPWR